jgi:hypothetical protein
MKPKNFLLVAFFVAIAGAGIWWFMRPMAIVPEKAVAAPTPVEGNAPKLVTQVAQVELPKLPPAIPSAETAPIMDAPIVADPRTNLDTAIGEYIHVLETNNMVGFWKDYYTPSTLKQLPPGAVEGIAQRTQQDTNMMQGLGRILSALRSTQGQTPTMSADGNTATYDTSTADAGNVQIVFKKKDGLWYFKIPKN